MSDSPVMAVDVGNNTIRVAGLDSLGEPRMITNKEKEDFTPCAILFEKNGTVLGRTAMSERVLRPGDVVTNFKPKMGTEEILFQHNGREYRARDLFAETLKHLKLWMEKIVGRPIKDVILTVPEQWGTTERLDVVRAAKLAGLHVKELISEPVAAAVGYRLAEAGSIVMVLDIGSSTTDVSIMRISDENGQLRYEVLGTEGELVGGRDIEQVIQEAVLAELNKQKVKPDPSDLTFFCILGERIQNLKETLSEIERKAILVECQGKRLTYTLTRAELESLTGDVLKRMLDLCPKAMAGAKLKWSDITDIVPVGGAVKMPAVIEALKKFGPPVREDVDPDRATVYGAARIGGTEEGYSIEGKLLPATNLQVEEVVPLDLAVSAFDGQTGGQQAFVLVPQNSRIPASGEERFDLLDPEHQDKAQIMIVEGKQGAPPAECRVIDEFLIQDLPIDPDRTAGRIEVKFEISKKGIAEVKVLDSLSGREFNRTLKYE